MAQLFARNWSGDRCQFINIYKLCTLYSVGIQEIKPLFDVSYYGFVFVMNCDDKVMNYVKEGIRFDGALQRVHPQTILTEPEY